MIGESRVRVVELISCNCKVRLSLLQRIHAYHHVMVIKNVKKETERFEYLALLIH